MWYFTFGCGHLLGNCYIKIHGSRSDTRARINDEFKKWSNQYSVEEWFSGNGISLAEKWGWFEIPVRE